MRHGPIEPSDPEIEAPNLRAIFGVKVLALGLVLGSFWVMQLFVSPFDNPYKITLAVVAGLIPAVAVVSWSGRVPVWLLRLSLYSDVVALSYGMHLSGGVDNVSVPLLFPVIISLAGLILRPMDTFLIAGLCAISYDTVVLAEYLGWLPHRVPYSRPPARQFATAVPVNLYFFLYAWLVSFTMERIRALYRRTEEVRREAMHDLAHDLKNPLSVIYGYAQMLLSSPPDQRESYARGIERTAQQALDLMSNVLDAEAIDGRPLTPRRHKVLVADLVLDVAERYRHTAEAAKVELRTQIRDPVSTAEVDGQMVARALGNLISNAIKYGGAGVVTVAAAVADGRLEIHVTDAGAGIPADEIPLLFRRHSRTSSSRGIEGSGLGLYIVRCIAEAHGGSVSVDSTPGHGARFTLSLPT